MYTAEDITRVISGHFLPGECSVEMVDENGGRYKFLLIPAGDMDQVRLGDALEDMYDSGLFDITNRGREIDVEFLDPVLERHEFNYIQEAKNWISFDDKQLANMDKLWKELPDRHKTNTFFKSLHDQLMKDKKLSKKQLNALNKLFKNGISSHDDNLFTVKN